MQKVQNKIIEQGNNISLTKGDVPDPGKRQFIKKGVLGIIAGIGIAVFSKIAIGVQSVNAAEGIITFVEFDDGNSGTADTIDWNKGQKHKSTLTGNVTFTFINPADTCNIILRLVQDATGSRTVTWPASVKWPAGTAPTLTTTANSVDVVAFYFDGTNYLGVATLDFS